MSEMFSISSGGKTLADRLERNDIIKVILTDHENNKEKTYGIMITSLGNLQMIGLDDKK